MENWGKTDVKPEKLLKTVKPGKAYGKPEKHRHNQEHLVKYRENQEMLGKICLNSIQFREN